MKEYSMATYNVTFIGLIAVSLYFLSKNLDSSNISNLLTNGISLGLVTVSLFGLGYIQGTYSEKTRNLEELRIDERG